jgi:ABC-type bacteriocin/lantibiotic exporter with double-glycine peptidase domain
LVLDKPDYGTLSDDGQDIANLDIVSLRHQMGLAMQNFTVSSGDTYNKITAAALHSLDEASEAARIAALEDDVKAISLACIRCWMKAALGHRAGSASA